MAFCSDPLRLPCWIPVLVDGMVCDRCYAESSQHAMRYSAGVIGLGRARSTQPGWECPCGGWRFRAQAMPRRKTGNNKIEAERSYSDHCVDEAEA
jgi:hypothetical protein